MTGSEYVKLKNLQHVRLIWYAIGQIDPQADGIDEDKFKEFSEFVYQLTQELPEEIEIEWN